MKNLYCLKFSSSSPIIHRYARLAYEGVEGPSDSIDSGKSERENKIEDTKQELLELKTGIKGKIESPEIARLSIFLRKQYDSIIGDKPAWEKVKKSLTPQILNRLAGHSFGNQFGDFMTIIGDKLFFSDTGNVEGDNYSDTREDFEQHREGSHLFTPEQMKYLLKVRKFDSSKYVQYGGSWLESGNDPKKAKYLEYDGTIVEKDPKWKSNQEFNSSIGAWTARIAQ